MHGIDRICETHIKSESVKELQKQNGHASAVRASVYALTTRSTGALERSLGLKIESFFQFLTDVT